MSNIISIIVNLIVSVGGIPYITNLLKKIIPKLNRFAPIVAIILAVIYVLVGNLIGLNLNLVDTISKVLLAFGLAGGSVLAYDTIKTTIRGK